MDLGRYCQKTGHWYHGNMKTTLDLPDDLVREIKTRAVKENRKLKDAIADLLRRGLSQKTVEPPTVRNLVKLPLVPVRSQSSTR